MGTAWAMSANQGGAQGGMGGLMGFLPMLIFMFLIMYFLIIRPQQKKQKELKNMMENLKKGDKVITSGGMIGSIVGLKDDIVIVKIAENTKVEFRKSAIVSVTKEEGTPENANS
jgi:preprotein translocase subunit YajC